MVGSKSRATKEIGAIHPCQMPMKNPAGARCCIAIDPGMQDESSNSESTNSTPSVFLCSIVSPS